MGNAGVLPVGTDVQGVLAVVQTRNDPRNALAP